MREGYMERSIALGDFYIEEKGFKGWVKAKLDIDLRKVSRFVRKAGGNARQSSVEGGGAFIVSIEPRT